MNVKNTTEHIVVLGAGYAGMMATLRLSHRLKSRHARITLLNATDTFVERIRLHQLAADQTLKHRPIKNLLRGTGVDFVQGFATRIDPDVQTIHLKTQTGVQTLTYDKLIYALGSYTDIHRVPGVAEHAYAIGKADGAAALRYRLREVAAVAGYITVVGGGLTGIETATEIAETYPALTVRLLTNNKLGWDMSPTAREHLLNVMRRLGVQVTEGVRVAAVDANAAVLDSGEVVPHDTCVWAGSFAVPSLAAESGFAVNGRGQIQVDRTLRSVSHPNVYAAGDAAVPVEDVGAPLRMACAVAMPMGVQAGENVAAAVVGAPQVPFGFGYMLRCISLGRHDALVQFVNADDSPQERIATGRMGTLIKEFICRYTVLSMHMERRLPGLYWWPGQIKSADATTTPSERVGQGA